MSNGSSAVPSRRFTGPRYRLLFLLVAFLSIMLTPATASPAAAPADAESMSTTSKTWTSLPACARACVTKTAKNVKSCKVTITPSCMCKAEDKDITAAKTCVKKACAKDKDLLADANAWFKKVCKKDTPKTTTTKKKKTTTTSKAAKTTEAPEEDEPETTEVPSETEVVLTKSVVPTTSEDETTSSSEATSTSATNVDAEDSSTLARAISVTITSTPTSQAEAAGAASSSETAAPASNSLGMIAGVSAALGVSLTLLAVGGGLFFYRRRRQQRRPPKPPKEGGEFIKANSRAPSVAEERGDFSNRTVDGYASDNKTGHQYAAFNFDDASHDYPNDNKSGYNYGSEDRAGHNYAGGVYAGGDKFGSTHTVVHELPSEPTYYKMSSDSVPLVELPGEDLSQARQQQQQQVQNQQPATQPITPLPRALRIGEDMEQQWRSDSDQQFWKIG